MFAKNTVRTAENDASIKAEQHKVQRGGNKGFTVFGGNDGTKLYISRCDKHFSL